MHPYGRRTQQLLAICESWTISLSSHCLYSICFRSEQLQNVRRQFSIAHKERLPTNIIPLGYSLSAACQRTCTMKTLRFINGIYNADVAPHSCDSRLYIPGLNIFSASSVCPFTARKGLEKSFKRSQRRLFEVYSRYCLGGISSNATEALDAQTAKTPAHEAVETAKVS